MASRRRNTEETRFFLPLHGSGSALARLSADSTFKEEVEASFAASNLASQRSVISVDGETVGRDALSGGLADADPAAASGSTVRFITGTRRRAGGDDDYFDHMDSARFVSACHTGISPSRTRAMGSWRRRFGGLISARNVQATFMAPGSREHALRDGCLLRIRHEMTHERRARRLRQARGWGIEVEEGEDFLLVYLVSGETKVGPVPVSHAETGVGPERFIRTLEEADGVSVIRRPHERKGQH